MNWEGSKYLTEILGQVMLFMPKLLSAMALFFIGMLIARITSRFISKILSKTRIDALSNNINRIEFIDKMNIKFSISRIIGKFIYYFIVLVFLVIATDILQMSIISTLIVDIINFIPNLMIALIMLVGGLLLANWLKSLVYTIAKSLSLPSASVISNLVFYFILINVLISAMMQIRVNVEFLSTNLSLVVGGAVFAFALAYGLASRPILANIISSFYLRDIYNEGDHVVIGNYEGVIVEKDNFNIILQSENDRIVIPISRLSENEVIIKDKK
jgi:hypothetical protein